MKARLIASMRDLLIEHIDGPVPLQVRDFNRLNRIRSAIEQGWIRHDNCATRPKHTHLTEEGRRVLSYALGDWADAIDAGEISTTIAVLAVDIP